MSMKGTLVNLMGMILMLMRITIMIHYSRIDNEIKTLYNLLVIGEMYL